MEITFERNSCRVSFDDTAKVGRSVKVTPVAMVDWADDVTPVGVIFLRPVNKVTFKSLEQLFQAAPYLSFAAGGIYVAFARAWERAACAAELSAAGRAGAADMLLQQAGMADVLTVSDVTYAPPEVLTPREREVLVLTAEGKSSREVGELLSRSARTVETQLLSARRKLGLPAHGKVELAKYIDDHGLA